MGPTKSLTNLVGVFSLRVAKVCGGLCVQLFAQPELNTSPDNHRWNLQMPEDTSSVATFLDRAAEARCGGGENFRVAATYSNMSFLGWHFRAENLFFGCLLATSCCFFFVICCICLENCICLNGMVFDNFQESSTSMP